MNEEALLRQITIYHITEQPSEVITWFNDLCDSMKTLPITGDENGIIYYIFDNLNHPAIIFFHDTDSDYLYWNDTYLCGGFPMDDLDVYERYCIFKLLIELIKNQTPIIMPFYVEVRLNGILNNLLKS